MHSHEGAWERDEGEKVSKELENKPSNLQPYTFNLQSKQFVCQLPFDEELQELYLSPAKNIKNCLKL